MSKTAFENKAIQIAEKIIDLNGCRVATERIFDFKGITSKGTQGIYSLYEGDKLLFTLQRPADYFTALKIFTSYLHQRLLSS